jgi:hypothetical protein
MPLFKNKNRKAKQVLSGGGYHRRGKISGKGLGG